ncbi:MAG: glycosyltransferase family 2 protein [Victivallales bacterium]|nr:glycosyltransferase family 2 protein [Victivallales bacterium]
MKLAPEYIWTIIPVYNHAVELRQVVCKTLENCPRVLVVDDGSTDAVVADLLSGTGAEVVSHSRNMGKGHALRTGFEYVAGRGCKYAITLDADGQHNPEDIQIFLPHISPDGRTIVLGTRDFGSSNVPGKSKFGRGFSNFWIKWQTGREVHDSQSGFRAYPGELIRNVRCLSGHYDFETEILVRGIWMGMDVKNVNISVHYPKKGVRISHFRTFSDNLRISRLHTRLTFERMFLGAGRQVGKT